MKKIIICTLLTAFSLVAFAQQHLTFKGVPIDGTLNEYTEAMKAKGFTYLGTQDGISILKGDFAAVKNCTIGVSTLKNLNVVSMIAVIFPEKENWAPLLSDYDALKEMLTEKYGAPSEVLEQFNTYSESDGAKMHALFDQELDWYTIFSTELGNIELTISSTDYGKGSVVLRYRDKVNSDKVRQSALDDL